MDPKDLEIKKLKKEIAISSIKQYGFILLFVAEIIFIGAIFMNFFHIKNPFSEDSAKAKIAVLHIDEPITTRYIERLTKALEKIKKEKEYKALLVDVSSPGGSPTASQEFSEYLKDFNKTMPVTMYVNSIAASGAYYIASAIKPIYANKNAIVGSIGVIMPIYNVSELAQKVGVKENTITAGKFKQPISLFKDLTKENKEYIENSMLKPTYENFVEDVAKNRGLKKEELEKYAEGKIYIASMPEIKGILVDEVTNLYKVKEKLKKEYKDAEFKTIGEKKTPQNFLNVLFTEALSLLTQKEISLR